MSTASARRAARPPRPVLFVGGGTAGHLAPGFAIAEHLADQGLSFVFAVPGERGEAAWFPAHWPPPLPAPALRLPRGAVDVPAFPARFLGAVGRALGQLRRLAPGAVVGLGGWPCAPAAVAARLAGVPLALVASDAVAGLAVRVLAPLADRVYLADARAAKALGRHPGVRVVGPLLRRAIRAGRARAEAFGLDPGRLTLFVTGGSLGARTLNEKTVEAVRHLLALRPALRDRLQVLHSVGRSGAGVAEAWAEVGVPHVVEAFVRDMGTAYATADLVIARSGAVTCAELEATGRPAVLVPYPHHGDQQQLKNAQALAGRGGAVLVQEKDLDATRLGALLLGLLEDADRRAAMSAALREASAPDGALQTALDLVRLLRGERNRERDPCARSTGTTPRPTDGAGASPCRRPRAS